MTLRIEREPSVDGVTLGRLYVNDAFFCYTLEDGVRDVKVAGETAIPFGHYRVVVDLSQRFGKLMPRLLDVPGFSGIRMHSGNTIADTSGCILLGMTRGRDQIGASRAAIDLFLPRLQKALDTQDVWIDIVSESEKPLKA